MADIVWITECQSSGGDSQARVLSDWFGDRLALVKARPIDADLSTDVLEEDGVIYPVGGGARTLADVVLRQDPEVVVFHAQNDVVYDAFPYIDPFVPTAVRIGANLNEWWNVGHYYMREIPRAVRFIQGFDAVIAASPTTRSRLVALGVQRDRITVIPTCIDAGRASGPDCDRDAVGILSRLSPVKNHLTLLQAGGVLNMAGDCPLLYITGRDETELGVSKHDVLADAADAMGVGKRVALTGHIPPGDLFDRVGLHVLPSVTENMPMALLEAAVNGVPSIVSETRWATDVGALGDETVHVDDPASMAATIRRYMRDDDARRELAERQQRTVEGRFDVSDVGELYCGVFEELQSRASAFTARGGARSWRA